MLTGGGGGAQNGQKNADVINERPLRNNQIRSLSNLQLPGIPQRNHAVKTCSTGTCDLKTIEEFGSVEKNLDDLMKDEVFFPPLTPENFRSYSNCTDQLHSHVNHLDAVEGRGRRGDRERRDAPDL